MAIGAGAAGAWAATNATTHTVTLPAHAAGDLLVVIAACKASTVSSVDAAITTPSTGWLRIGSFADGSVASGTGTGSVNQAIFVRTALTSSETNPVITWGGSQTAAPGIAVGLSFTKSSSDMWVPAAIQKALNVATSISVTMDQNPGITSGDWGLVAITSADDSALTVPTWTATSATLGTAVVYPATPIASGTSNDMAGTAAYRSVTSGTASAAPVVTATQVAAENGVTAFVRLRTQTATPYSTAVAADAPVAWYRMGEPSGSVVDSIGGNNGTVTGTVTRDVAGLVATDDGAISFAGSGYFEANWPAALTNTFSIEVMLNVPAVSAAWATFMSSADIALSLRLDTGVLIAYMGAAFNRQANSPVTGRPRSGIHHFVWSRSGNTFATNKLYVDGVDVSSNTGLTGMTNPDTATTFRFGEYIDGSESFLGTADELAIYDYALTQAQVEKHFAAIVVPAANQLATPTTAALVITKNIPTVTASNHQSVTPTTKALTLTTFIPQARTPILATPAAVSLTATKFAPTVTATANQRVTPTTATLTATKYAPTVTTPERVTPITKALALAAFAPTITVTAAPVVPTTKALTLTTFAPLVSATAHQTAIPPAVALTLTEFAPNVSATAHQTLVPATAVLELAEQVPTVAISDHQSVTVPKATLTLTAYEPTTTPTDDKVAIPTTKVLTLSTYAPTIINPNPQLVTVPTATLTLAKYAPTARTPILATPTTKALTITRFAPTVRTPILATPTTKALTLAAFQPTIASPRIVVPGKATLVTARFAPTISTTAHQTVTPTTKALALTAYAPVARVAYRFTPTAAALVTASFAPTVSSTQNALVRPGPAALTITEYAPVIPLTGHQLVEPATAALVLTTYPPTAEQHSITPLPRILGGTVVVARGPGATVAVSGRGSTTVVVTRRPSARVSR